MKKHKNMSKKICIFTSHYLPYLGGVENYTYHLSRQLIENGNKVLVVTNNDMHLASYEKMDGIHVIRIPCINLMKGRYPVFKLNKDFFRLWKKISDIKFDLVLINTRFYPHTVLGCVYAKSQKVKAVILDHGTSHMTIGKPVIDFVFAVVEHGITLIDKVLCKDYYGVSKACCDWLLHFHIKAAGVLYNAVNTEIINKHAHNPRRDFRKEYNISNEGILITYTGRLIKEKGIYELIEAVKLIPNTFDVHLMIAGDGEEMGTLRKIQNNRIILLGRLNNTEIYELLGQSEIFCLPTKYPEGFPTSVLEAAAASCYIITTNKGGSVELIKDVTYGRILESVDAESICQAILFAIKHPLDREKAADKANKYVNQTFTWKKIAGQVEGLAEDNERSI